jgi:mono/diheme cytochrome c family protein
MRYSTDDLRAASSAGLITPAQLDSLLSFLGQRAPAEPAGPKFDVVHMLWYFGALIVIGAMGLFSTLAFAQAGGTALTATAAVVASGSRLYAANCGVCHGAAAIAVGIVPDLRSSPFLSDDGYFDIVLNGSLKERGMVSFAAEVSAGGAVITRSFDGFWEAAQEAGASRIYGGIHWSFDNEAGLEAGHSVGEFVANNLLRARGNSALAGDYPGGVAAPQRAVSCALPSRNAAASFFSDSANDDVLD